MSDQHPFDVREFIKENKKLVKKFIKKNTSKVDVGDFEITRKQGYKGNPAIKDGLVEFPEYTTMQKLEYIKCMRDCVYFTQKYITIISIDDGIIPFNLYDYQEELINKFQHNRFTIALQCRQSGKSQTVAAYILWFNTFNPTKYTAILANKAAQAAEILSRVQLSYEGLPNWLKPGVKSYNKRSMEFANKSTIVCAASTGDSIRGKSVSLLYIDECAFLRGDMEFYESTYPVVSSGKKSRIIITSTPNCARGLFYKLWTESVEGVNRYANHKVTWDMVPGRDEEWRDEQIANTSKEQFDQEFNCLFRGSAYSLISGDVLMRLPEFSPVRKEGNLKIFEEPKKGNLYACTVDSARGTGNDYSAFIIFDVTQIPYRVVATYKDNRISPMIFPSIIYSAAIHYNNAMTLVELNDIGEQVASILQWDYEYEELLCTIKQKNRQTLWYGGDSRPGVTTSVAVKSIGCSNAKTLIESDKLELKDRDVIDEFGTFIPKGRSYEADEGAHDDLAMCCVLFSWLTAQQYFADLTNIDTRKEVMKDRENDEWMLPAPVVDNGVPNEEPKVVGGFEVKGVDTSDPFFDGF